MGLLLHVSLFLWNRGGLVNAARRSSPEHQPPAYAAFSGYVTRNYQGVEEALHAQYPLYSEEIGNPIFVMVHYAFNRLFYKQRCYLLRGTL